MDSMFNRCMFTDGKKMSTDFTELAKSQKNLTFDTRYLSGFRPSIETPFNEIWLADPKDYCPEDIPSGNLYNNTYDKFIDDIEKTLEENLMKIDPNREYLFSHSSGSDSRIISGTMAKMKREGKHTFDNIKFVCWGRPEEPGFKKIMQRGGWDDWFIHDDTISDAYDIGRTDISVDGWYPYTCQTNFWSEIEPKKYTLIAGVAGDAYQYPYNTWIHRYEYFGDRGETLHRQSRIFDGVFCPFLDVKLLKLLMSMPSQWRKVPDTRLGRDKLRTDLVARLGMLNIPINNPCYNWNISPTRKKDMLLAYDSSKFKQDYKVKLDIKQLFENPIRSNESRIWAFATTVYEKVLGRYDQ